MQENTRIPIIRLYGNIVVPVQVSLTDELVRTLQQDIATEIEKRPAIGLVVDLSGVEVMDSYITGAIRRISLMAQLMGVRTIISGLSPAIAETLVEMGMDLQGIRTALDLESAIENLRAEAARSNAEFDLATLVGSLESRT